MPSWIDRLFVEHPADVGETYGEHFMMAGGFGLRMIGGGLACLVHALVPALFVKTASLVVKGLHDQLVVNRRRARPGRPVPAVLEYTI